MSFELNKIVISIDFASGASIDWVYATQNVSLAYTIELRDKGMDINLGHDHYENYNLTLFAWSISFRNEHYSTFFNYLDLICIYSCRKVRLHSSVRANYSKFTGSH